MHINTLSILIVGRTGVEGSNSSHAVRPIMILGAAADHITSGGQGSELASGTPVDNPYAPCYGYWHAVATIDA